MRTPLTFSSRDPQRLLPCHSRTCIAATLLATLALTACGSSGSDDSNASSGDAAGADTVPIAPGNDQPVQNDPAQNDAPTPVDGAPPATPGDGNDQQQGAQTDDTGTPTNDTTTGTPDDSSAAPGAPVETAPAMTTVEFLITVPRYSSEELQLDVAWGQNEVTASYVQDESWRATALFPANTEDRLVVTFYDNFGSTTLATYTTDFSTGDSATQSLDIAAADFDSSIWDNDEDGISNLDELRAGTDPDFAEAIGAPEAPAELISIEYSGYDLELFWPRAIDADGVVIGYDIYRDDEQVQTRLDALSYYDGSVRPETDYTYDVYAVDNLGNRSQAATLVVTTPEDVPLSGVEANTARLSGGDGSVWTIGDGVSTSDGAWTSGSCSYGNGAGSGVGVIDANLPDNYDAFDFGSMMWINGMQVGGYLRSSNGSTSNYASVPIANLEVSTELHAVSTQAVLRNYTSFNNDTDEDIFIVVNVASNFGSDGGTQITQSSSGDFSFGSDDRWVITDDGNTDGADPANTSVFFGPDSPASASVFTGDSVFNCYGDQGLTARMDVLIPAGERRALMLFHAMSVSSADAVIVASQFDSTPLAGSDLVEGLSAAQLAAVVNWNY